MNKKAGKKIAIWEQKILRKIYGGVDVRENKLTKRTNEEIKVLYGQSEITQVIRAKRLGQRASMNNNRWIKRVLSTERRGRQKAKRTATKKIARCGQKRFKKSTC